jgi:CRP-like cAMP-binding protein
MPTVSEPEGKANGTPDAVTLLKQAGAESTLAKHRRKEIIFSQGSRADTVFYLQRGRVKLSVVSKQGKEAVIGILSAGCFFGEGCLAGRSIQVATATALVDCAVLLFKRKHVLAAIRNDPDFAELFVTYLLQRTARIEEDFVDQLFNSSEKRLARVLLLLGHFASDDRPDDFAPNVSQETLARMIGTTRPRVNFFMNKFRRLGFIDYENGLRVHASLLTKVLRD